MPAAPLKSVKLTSRQKRAVITVAAAILFYLLFGFLGAPFIVRGILEGMLGSAIDRRVTVGQVRVNPLTLSVALRHLDVRERDGSPFLAFDEGFANLQVSSAYRWALVLKTVRLVNPEVHLIRTAAATFNFSDIGRDRPPRSPEPENPADAGRFGLVVDDLHIMGGRVTLDDRMVSVNHRVEGLNLSVSNFSSRPADKDDTAAFRLSARVNDAGVSLKGRSRPFRGDHETHASVSLEAVRLVHYLPYVYIPPKLIVQSVSLQTETEIDFRMLADGQPELVVSGQSTLGDLRVTDHNGDPFVYHPHLTFDLLPSKVLTGQLRFGTVESDKPEYFLKRLPSGDLYLPFLAETAYEKAEEKSQADASGEFQPLVTIDAINLTQAIVHLTDLSNREPFSATIRCLDLAVDNFGLNSDRIAAYRLALYTDADETISLEGTASLFPMQAVGDVSLTGIQIPRYAPYFQDRLGFRTASGRVTLGGSYRLRQTAESILVSLSGIHLTANTLKLLEKKSNAPMLSLGRLEVADTMVDLARREISLGRLAVDDTRLFCRRGKDGTLNLVEAVVPTPAAAAGDPASPEAESSAAYDAAPFVVKLGKIGFTDLTVDVTDFVPQEPVHLRMDNLAFTAADLSTAPGQTGRMDLSLRWMEQGRLRVGGEVSINPPSLDATVDITAMDVRPFQPYLSERVGLIVTHGRLDTNGRFQFSGGGGAASPSITYRGNAGINRFASIDSKNADDFLKWEALRLDTLKLAMDPLEISVDRIRLDDFFARVIVDPSGSLNLISMFSQTEGPPAGNTEIVSTPKTKKEEPDEKNTPSIRIDRIILSDGDVDFSDQYIKPNYGARFQQLGGQILGLASIDEKRADVLLNGLWGSHAPVKISGRINPLIEPPYADLNLNISDIELSPFSPYSGKYIGYILEKGKLTFNVDYLMQNRKLEGKNSIFINQLTLGDTVDSPDAVNLPIKLAVALLKDREGNIQLDLPVSGSLDDPQFKIGKVILTILKNLIVKIVTSPFAALGALAGGGGEELSYLDFDAGVSEIDPANSLKMDKLAKILFERPALKLDIQGTVAPQVDREALEATLLENRLKAQKLKQMMKAGESAVPLEEITITAEERTMLLRSVIETAGISAPVDGSGKPVAWTTPVMEELLRGRTAVTEDDYRRLANARAFNAKDYLVEHGRVARGRLFIVEPRIDAAGLKTESAPRGRVVFSLK